MTTANTNPVVKTPKSPGRYRLPDPPPREPDEMTTHANIPNRLYFGDNLDIRSRPPRRRQGAQSNLI